MMQVHIKHIKKLKKPQKDILLQYIIKKAQQLEEENYTYSLSPSFT